MASTRQLRWFNHRKLNAAEKKRGTAVDYPARGRRRARDVSALLQHFAFCRDGV
jgi:hypothetical protein